MQFEYTALIYATSSGHTECVRLLLDGGASADAKDYVCRRTITLQRLFLRVWCVRQRVLCACLYYFLRTYFCWLGIFLFGAGFHDCIAVSGRWNAHTKIPGRMHRLESCRRRESRRLRASSPRARCRSERDEQCALANKGDTGRFHYYYNFRKLFSKSRHGNRIFSNFIGSRNATENHTSKCFRSLRQNTRFGVGPQFEFSLALDTFLYACCQPSQGGHTILIRATQYATTDCVRLLVEAGADTAATDAVRSRSAFSVLQHLSHSIHTTFLTIDIGVCTASNVCSCSLHQQGYSALDHARRQQHSAIVDLLTANAAGV